jgi:ectoine hydroxylase-related dioxygenase (phytanoyl-CoA dioxygenase family)
MRKNIEKYINEINSKGFVLIENMLSERECEKYKLILNKIYEKFHSKYAISKIASGLSDKSLEKVVFNLHNKDISFFKLFENSLVLSILDIILKKGSYMNKEPYYLNNISARCPLNGNKGQIIHLDSNLPGVNYNLITNVVWYFDDVNKENGTTIVIPGSHKFSRYADNNKKIKNKIYINAKKGSVLVFNGNLWHGGSSKFNDKSRWALLLGYARWFIKPTNDYMKNTPIKIFNKLTSAQKSLLGFHLNPPKDEFTRLRRISEFHETPDNYKLF